MFAMGSQGFFETVQTVFERFVLQPCLFAEICDGGLRLAASGRV